MGQLVIVVIAIVLMAITVAGGVSYLRSDMGVRTEVAQRAMSSYQTYEMAFGAYRVANGGAMPRAGAPGDAAAQATWRAELAPYIPGSDATPKGMVWTFSKVDGDRRLCLTSQVQPLSEAVRSGLAQAASKLDGASLVSSCDGTSAVTGAPSALLVSLKTGA